MAVLHTESSLYPNSGNDLAGIGLRQANQFSSCANGNYGDRSLGSQSVNVLPTPGVLLQVITAPSARASR
jgi:hypothetical protein